jgi:hypothetical protein
MTETRQPTETQARIVVRGGTRLAEVWPAEPLEPVAPVRAAAELGDVSAVLELLAAVDGEDTDVYGHRHRHQAMATRALTAHCRAAVLRAALQVEGRLTPAAVLDELHSGLRRPIDPLLELLAS